MSDALAEVLDTVRMRGSVFSRANMRAPFGVASGRTSQGVFHAVVKGSAWASRASTPADRVRLESGDVVVFPFGDDHLILDSPTTRARPIEFLTTVDERGMGQLIVDGTGERTSLLCGNLSFVEPEAHPLFSVLPPMIHVRDPAGSVGRYAESLIELIAAEIDEPRPGSDTIVARLTDVLVVVVLRAYLETLEPGEGGWLGALGQPGLAEAVRAIHREPERAWTATDLAALAGMSRSTFYACFTEAVGESPGSYLRRWRIHVACRLMREDGLSAAAAGRRIGYRTEAAFSNAFVGVMGMRPGAYRRAG